MAASTETTTAPAIDRAEVTRTLNLVKHEVGLLFADATRKLPFYAASTKEAESKFAAALEVLGEFAGQLDAIKKQ